MIPPLIAGAGLLRPIKIAAIGLLVALVIHGQFARLVAESRLARCRSEKDMTSLLLSQAQAMTRALVADSRRRAEMQQAALGEAKRHNAQEQPHIEALDRSSRQQRRDDRCAVSETLKAAEIEL